MNVTVNHSSWQTFLHQGRTQRRDLDQLRSDRAAGRSSDLDYTVISQVRLDPKRLKECRTFSTDSNPQR